MKPQIKKDICDKLQEQWQVLERKAHNAFLRVDWSRDGSIIFHSTVHGNPVVNPPYDVAVEAYRMFGLLEMLRFMQVGFCTVNGRWKIIV